MNKEIYMKKLSDSQKYEPSEIDIKVLRKDIIRLRKILCPLMKSNNVADPNQIKKYSANITEIIFKGCTQSSYIDSALYEYFARKDILSNPSIIDNEYPIIKDEPFVNKIFNADKTRSYRLLLIKALSDIKGIEQFSKEHNITAKSNYNDFIITNKTKDSKRNFQSIVNLSKEKNLRSKILFILKEEQKIFEENLKKNQIDSLKSLYDFFKTFNFSEGYVYAYNSNRNKFGISGLDITEEDFENIFKDETLQDLSLEQLCFLNITWLNRCAKESSRLNIAFNAINSLDLWKDILDENQRIELTDSDLRLCLQKTNFLKKLLKDSFNIHSKHTYQSELAKPSDEDYISYNFTNFYENLQAIIQEDYETYFQQNGLKNNDFLDDASLASSLNNLEMILYRKKDTTLDPIILNMLTSNHCKNWGISRYELKNNELVDTLSTHSKSVLLTFDIKGLNAPLSYHISTYRLSDLAKQISPDAIIQEYQGHEDFILNGSVVPSNIVMPVPKHHKKTIMDNSKIENSTQRFWQHLYFLMNGKLPDHFMETVNLSGKKTALTRKPIHYSSLITGKRYIKEKNNFVEVDIDGR